MTKLLVYVNKMLSLEEDKMVSEREIRNIFRSKYGGEISSDCIKQVQETIKEILNEIIDGIINDFQETNKYREIQKIPKLKRISKSNVYKAVKGSQTGEIGYHQNKGGKLFYDIGKEVT